MLWVGHLRSRFLRKRPQYAREGNHRPLDVHRRCEGSLKCLIPYTWIFARKRTKPMSSKPSTFTSRMYVGLIQVYTRRLKSPNKNDSADMQCRHLGPVQHGEWTLSRSHSRRKPREPSQTIRQDNPPSESEHRWMSCHCSGNPPSPESGSSGFREAYRPSPMR